MKLLWIYKSSLEALKKDAFENSDIPNDHIFYGTIQEVKDFTDLGYSKFEDWTMFFSFES